MVEVRRWLVSCNPRVGTVRLGDAESLNRRSRAPVLRRSAQSDIIDHPGQHSHQHTVGWNFHFTGLTSSHSGEIQHRDSLVPGAPTPRRLQSSPLVALASSRLAAPLAGTEGDTAQPVPSSLWQKGRAASARLELACHSEAASSSEALQAGFRVGGGDFEGESLLTAHTR